MERYSSGEGRRSSVWVDQAHFEKSSLSTMVSQLLGWTTSVVSVGAVDRMEDLCECEVGSLVFEKKVATEDRRKLLKLSRTVFPGRPKSP